MRVLSPLFRRLFLAGLADAHAAGGLAFAAHLAPLRRKNWFVYAESPFTGPEAVLAYLARYTHRVAISNNRLIALDKRGVTFRYKDNRRNGPARYCTMTLAPMSSSGASCCTFYPRGSTASDITDCCQRQLQGQHRARQRADGGSNGGG